MDKRIITLVLHSIFDSLIYAVAMEDDDKERSDIYKERATEFAKSVHILV